MNVFYEEDGGFKVGAVLSENDASYQVEAAHGKRSKIKAANVLLKFETPGLAAFMASAEEGAAAIDLDFLWEVAPKEEFGYTELGGEYFGHPPSAAEGASLLMRLHGAPMYFYKKGRGRYKAAPEEALKAALASIERKKREAELQAEYTEQLSRFELPEALKAGALQLLYKPDKQSVAYKALEAAAAAAGISAPQLMHRAGALAGPYEHYLKRFMLEHFPRGTGFPAHPAPQVPGDDLPLAESVAFSIDDVSTTEIDDAFTVQKLINGRVRVGIHIAAPGLGFAPEGELDRLAHARMSTVYMPGDKITMLPDDVVEAFTLAEGRTVPCVSLYVDVEPADGAIAAEESKIERIRVAANLRHNALDALVTEENLESGAGEYPFKEEIAFLWKFANALETGRGRPSAGANFRDYNFHIDWQDKEAGAGRIEISERKRGAPLDKIVAELMILANRTWGKLLADRGAAGIYRVKTGVGPQGKVRMTSVPAPHIGLGVSHYAWSSSPLRRYVDLVNQWQLLAVLSGGKPPFGAKSEQLLGSIAAFDAAYMAYADFQESLERYWCLQWLEQHGYVGGTETLEAAVLREGLVRFEHLPLVTPVAGLPALERGGQVAVRVSRVDAWALGLEVSFAGIIAQAPAAEIAENEDAGENAD
ncbi:MAG TPA: RNB domain-containing ribonuclease [Burkholderiales bacterium]